MVDRKRDRTGAKIAGFKIVEKIGRGSLGEVYKAEHGPLNITRAFKFSLDEEYDPLFADEVKVVAKLDHPNILKLDDCQLQGDDVWLRMPYIAHEEGVHSVDEYVTKHGALSVAAAVGILKQALDALVNAHQKKIIHRDIKPSNLLLDAQLHCYLTDFNLAKVVSAEDSFQPSLRSTGGGSSKYQSPEQENPKCGLPIDQRTDVYSLGLTFNTMLLGKLLRTNPASEDKGIPAELGELVMSAIEPKYKSRCPSAKEFYARLMALGIAADTSPSQNLIAGFIAGLPDTPDVLGAEVLHKIHGDKRDLYYHLAQSGVPVPVAAVERAIQDRYERDMCVIKNFVVEHKQVPDRITLEGMKEVSSQGLAYRNVFRAWRFVLHHEKE